MSRVIEYYILNWPLIIIARLNCCWYSFK